MWTEYNELMQRRIERNLLFDNIREQIEVDSNASISIKNHTSSLNFVLSSSLQTSTLDKIDLSLPLGVAIGFNKYSCVGLQTIGFLSISCVLII